MKLLVMTSLTIWIDWRLDCGSLKPTMQSCMRFNAAS